MANDNDDMPRPHVGGPFVVEVADFDDVPTVDLAPASAVFADGSDVHDVDALGARLDAAELDHMLMAYLEDREQPVEARPAPREDLASEHGANARDHRRR